MKLVTAICLTATVTLSACALSEKQCVQGDWQGIGLKDGTKGRSGDFVANHVKACSKHGVSVDQSLWEQGRQQGLKTYCTASSAYNEGRDGRSLKDVCPTANLAELREAHSKGLRYHHLTRDIRDLERERNDIHQEIGRLSAQTDDPAAAARIHSLRSRVLQVNLRIDRLRLERRKYEYI